MPNTPNVFTTEEDRSVGAPEIPVGISGVLVELPRGPIADTSLQITSWQMCQRYFGGLNPDYPDTLIVKRILDGGSQLRICNVRHYTDPTDAGTLDADYAEPLDTGGPTIVGITGTMTAGNYTLAISGYTSSVVPFNTDVATTMGDLAEDFLSKNRSKLLQVKQSGETLLIVPSKGYTLSGIGITGTSVLSTTTTPLDDFSNAASEPLFIVTPYAPGAGYNDMVVDIRDASNGNPDYFNLVVYIQGEETFAEEYENILIPGPFSEGNLSFLEDAINNSYIAKFEYVDLTGLTDLKPVRGIRVFGGGSDGASTTDSDYIGDSSARTGFHAFDPIDDIITLAAPNKSTVAIAQGLTAYAERRKDLCGFFHLSNSLATVNALVSFRNSTNVDSSYLAFFAGGLKVLDPTTSQVINITELGDVLALAATSAVKDGPYKSFSGLNRGVFQNVQGVVNNFGTPGSYNDMNLIANHQINLAVLRNKRVVLWGSFTAQLSSSLLSFLNVRRLLIFIKKSLSPLLEQYIEEYNIITTWKLMYQACKPFMDDLANKGALQGGEGEGWRWLGDQHANNMNELVVNTQQAVNKGKYRIELPLTPTPPLQEITLAIIITSSGISFEEIS